MSPDAAVLAAFTAGIFMSAMSVWAIYAAHFLLLPISLTVAATFEGADFKNSLGAADSEYAWENAYALVRDVNTLAGQAASALWLVASTWQKFSGSASIIFFAGVGVTATIALSVYQPQIFTAADRTYQYFVAAFSRPLILIVFNGVRAVFDVTIGVVNFLGEVVYGLQVVVLNWVQLSGRCTLQEATEAGHAFLRGMQQAFMELPLSLTEWALDPTSAPLKLSPAVAGVRFAFYNMLQKLSTCACPAIATTFEAGLNVFSGPLSPPANGVPEAVDKLVEDFTNILLAAFVRLPATAALHVVDAPGRRKLTAATPLSHDKPNFGERTNLDHHVSVLDVRPLFYHMKATATGLGDVLDRTVLALIEVSESGKFTGKDKSYSSASWLPGYSPGIQGLTRNDASVACLAVMPLTAALQIAEQLAIVVTHAPELLSGKK